MVVGRVASVLALLGGGSVLFQDPALPVVRVNDDDALLSYWPSEDYHSELDAKPDCSFWSFNETYDASLCSHFTISRSATAVTKAAARALACAGAYATECVLSTEVGLALPAAFLFSEVTDSMRIVLAPKLVPRADPASASDATTPSAPQQHVRVAMPGGDGLTSTRTFLFNRSIDVEYLDGTSRAMVTSTLTGDAAYCVQLLTVAFEPACWDRIA